MHSPSHFVSRMSSSPTIVSGLHCSLPPSQIPMMGPSSSRPMSGPNNNERCRLHKRNHGDVDLDLLNKNDIWLGQNLVNPSKREELIPFHKVPLEDQLSSTLDNEERLVYCGSCLRYRVNDPLTLNLRYEQKDGVKIRVIHLRHGKETLLVILAEIKALRDGTDNMSFGLLKKNGEVCEDIQFVSPAQPFHLESIILSSQNKKSTNGASTSTEMTSAKPPNNKLDGQLRQPKSPVQRAIPQPIITVQPNPNELTKVNQISKEWTCPDYAATGRCSRLAPCPGKHSRVAQMVAQPQPESMSTDGPKSKHQRLSDTYRDGNIEKPQKEIETPEETRRKSFLIAAQPSNLTYSPTELATARRQKRPAIGNDESYSTRPQQAPSRPDVMEQNENHPRKRGDVMRSSKEAHATTNPPNSIKNNGRPGIESSTEKATLKTQARPSTTRQQQGENSPIARQSIRAQVDIWDVPVDDCEMTTEAIEKVLDESVASLDTSLPLGDVGTGLVRPNNLNVEVDQDMNRASPHDAPSDPVRDEDTSPAMSLRSHGGAGRSSITPVRSSSEHISNTRAPTVAELFAQCRAVYPSEEPGPFWFCPVKGCSRHYDNEENVMKKWRSESGVRKHLQKYHCPVPNASTPTTGLAESIHRDSAGSESASPIPGAALRNSATPAPTAPALDNAPELLPSSGNVRGHGDRHGADEPVLASCIAPVAVEPTGGIEENGEPEQVEEIYEDDVAAERLAETLRRMNEKEKKCEAARMERAKQEEEASVARRAKAQRLKEVNVQRRLRHKQEADRLKRDLEDAARIQAAFEARISRQAELDEQEESKAADKRKLEEDEIEREQQEALEWDRRDAKTKARQHLLAKAREELERR